MSGGPVGGEEAVELLLEAARERASTDRGRGGGGGGREEEDSEEGAREVEGIME